jgi:hypothetical protein
MTSNNESVLQAHWRLLNQKMDEILDIFDTSHQQIRSREEYAEMAKYLSDLAEGVGLDKKKSNKDSLDERAFRSPYYMGISKEELQ